MKSGLWGAAGAALILSACASLGSADKANPLAGVDATSAGLATVPVTPVAGDAAYTFAGKQQKAEWVDCKGKAAATATILIMHRDRAGWDRDQVCAGWIAQALVSVGFDVVAVNRPGYGASTGEPDFTGEQSLAALDAAVKDAAGKGGNAKPLTGIWGYATGATAAALYAKHAGSFQFMVLGGGLYDLDEVSRETADDYVKKDLEQIKKTGGAKALEDRSIGYDVAGLPKTIALYHARLDKTAPLAQAQSFSDSVASNGAYKVSLQILDDVPHEIPWAQHWKILGLLARGAAGGN